MLLFFNQEIIKYLDKKNEYLFIFNVLKREKQNEFAQIVHEFLFQKRKKKSKPDFLLSLYFLIIRQVFRYRQHRIGRSCL